ncbi:penicillin acylase family protein [Amycolatopsis nigrescens]|uniref:penicillin acylase family protein n=1 Tax=Amycolatopsis nigrescens TaxID=381445 RepID=UPI000382CCF3|nr:penicillin acylase family protein [Amycolatopsis nigrescens]
MALVALILVTSAPAVAEAGGARSTIRYTEHGVPHIVAKDFDGLGYGYGYAAAKDNICELANGYLTVSAQRSRHFGPDGTGNSALSSASGNLNSDLYFQRIIDEGTVERLAAQPAPLGPRAEVRELVSGYTQGYNRYLAETGPDGVTDPACRGADWLRPIDELDVYRHFYAIATVSGQGALADGTVTAAPSQPVASDTDHTATAERLKAGLERTLGTGELGSNGIAIGSEGVAENAGARSVLLGNPHYPWHGGRRFWQSQLTIPGRFDVSGASLLGVPLVQIGHTANAAWTHTVATPRTFGLFEVPLVPGDPTSYLVDGRPEKMTSSTVRVAVKQEDGSLGEVQRTLYGTRYGPVLTSATGVPLPWTGQSAHALRDGNAANLRGLNTWFGLNQAQSTGQILRALTETQGAPWVNTVATDRAGNALYSDVQVVPHVTDELERDCGTPLGHKLFAASAVSILDGGRSSCAWGTDADAVEPGLFGPARLPAQQRRDYTLNANDSAWLANAREPITGYPRIVGTIGTERSARTREALSRVEEVLSGKGFSTDSMKELLFAEHSKMAELAAPDAAKMCAAFPDGQAPSAHGPVDVRTACDALAGWDHSYRLDSLGSLLFERFVLNLGSAGGQWLTAFDPADPVRTPNTLNTGAAAVQTAFGNAAAELRDAGIPLDARLADYQSVTRNGVRIPLHGAPHQLGVLDVISPVWDARRGNVEVSTGSSFLQVVAFGRDACPDASTLLTYSQSADPTSPYFADQTELFSRGEWARGRFCERDILASPALHVVPLR